MSGALRVALVWLLVLITAPLGAVSLEGSKDTDLCASWCPCDDGQTLEQDNRSPHDLADAPDDCEDDCEDDCADECGGCCQARTQVTVGPLHFGSNPLVAVATPSSHVRDAPGTSLATGVFRPPRPLS